MKKLIASLLVLTMIITAMPLAIADEKIRTSGDFEYTIKGNGTATVVGYNGDPNEDIIIPNMLDGYVVTTIGKEAFAMTMTESQYTIKSVTLPESITSIEEKAFWNSGITSINIPNSVTHIGYGAFSHNSKQITFRISNAHPAYAVINKALYDKKKKELLYYYCDLMNRSEENMMIPEGIVSIGDYACCENTYTYSSRKGKGDQSYIDIHFPSTLKKIGDYAFAHVDTSNYLRIEVRIFNESLCLDSIGDYAFYGADVKGKVENGKSYDIQITATTIGDSSFEEAGIESMCLGEGTETIGNSAFKGVYSPHRDFVIPASVRELGAYCFYDGPEIIRFSEGSQLTTIEEWTFSRSQFYYFSGEGVYLPETSQIRSIGDHTFENAVVYNADSTLNGVETIGQYAFNNTIVYGKSEDELLISADCSLIPTYAFNGSGSDYKLQDGVEIIESFAFGRVEDFYLPNTLSDIAIYAFRDGSSFVVEQGSYAERWAEENAYPYSINGQEQNLDWLLN